MISIPEYKGLKEPPKGKNYLYFEDSLYLKQHEDNPVMWYPWCKEAFEKAKNENKLILVSIGYSTCHWCHVMERESFSDEQIAHLLNESFVAIKIDREEHPDLDRIFMRICEITVKNCGWPLNVVLTPDGLPIFVATYIPPETRGGMIGMKELIPRLREIWLNDKQRCISVGNSIISALNEIEKELTKVRTDIQISPDIISHAFEHIKNSFDFEFGGFGENMKFPNPSVLYFLLRFYSRTKDKEAFYMIEKTLDEMRYGGIYDHIAGGFHRYTVERTWTIPHFEKMLYDNAQLIEIYSEAYQLTKKDIYKQTVYQTFEFLLENFLDQKTGLFYSAQDAESEGEEGKFYLWRYDEIKEVLGENTDIFARYFGVSPYGNTQIFGNKNILRVSVSEESISKLYGIPIEEVRKIISDSLERLKAARQKRIHPHIDRKILVDINSLVIKALSKSAFIFDENKFLNVAKRNADFLLDYFNKNGILPHVIYENGNVVKGLLDDFSFFSEALLELFSTSQEVKYLKKAKEIVDLMIEEFYDYENGGFFTQPKNSDFVFIRQKDSFDSSIPSGNSSALFAIFKIYRITGEKKYLDIVEKTIQIFASSILSSPIFHSYFLSVIDFQIGQTYDFVISAKDQSKIKRFLDVLRNLFVPQKITIVLSDNNKNELAEISEFYAKLPVYDAVKVFICSEGVCKVPIDDPDQLNDFLRDQKNVGYRVSNLNNILSE